MYIRINGRPACEQERLVDSALARYERHFKAHHGSWPDLPIGITQCHVYTPHAEVVVKFLQNQLGFHDVEVVEGQCPNAEVEAAREEASYAW